MEIKKFIFKGFLHFDYSEDFKTIRLKTENTNIDLVKKFRAIFDLFESEVSVSYFISDNEETENKIKEEYLKRLFGSIEAKYEAETYNYSSYTYGTNYDTYLQIGGHNLFEEFEELYGKYCILKVSVKVERV